MSLNRRQLAQLYRPLGPKTVATAVPWTSGGVYNAPAKSFDLSMPIRGIRIVFKGRVVTGVANFTSVNPEGLLNLITNIHMEGQNKRVGGNAILLDLDLPSLFVVQHIFAYRPAYFDINGAQVGIPSTPFPTGYFSVNTGTYDFKIIMDIPFAPFDAKPGVVPGFLVRAEEWGDSLQFHMNFGAQAGAGATGVLGVSAGTTTVTFSANGSGAGTPTIDIYSLPMAMGLDLKDTVIPGFITRAQTPINNVLQQAGNNVTLANLNQQKTNRVYLKTGTSTVPPAFATLSDSNVTALGISLGGNRNVRNKLDVFAHKQTQQYHYQRDVTQGYVVMDFTQSGNPDAAYPADNIGSGSNFQLVADVAGVANGYGIILQEQIIYGADGALYQF